MQVAPHHQDIHKMVHTCQRTPGEGGITDSGAAMVTISTEYRSDVGACING
jgi:hypothetical protein